MPWMETSPVDQRGRFIRDHRLDSDVIVELCARFGISRKTGYKWPARAVRAGARLGRPRIDNPSATRGPQPYEAWR
jgi:transposase